MNEKAPCILAVDDTPEVLKYLVTLLTMEGYQVHPADSGESALAAAAAKPPDLILLDIRMKGMDGLEVCRRLKDREETRTIPIILVSAFADVEEWVKGLRIGAVDYVTKPFRHEELITRIKTHIALNRANLSLEKQAGLLCQINRQLQSEIAERGRVEEELRQNLDQARRSRLALLSAMEDRKRAEAERETLQAQLIQAQKMESVGRLAGGVAHDFNNMLGVIIGNAEIVRDCTAPDDPLHSEIQEILYAAKRSTEITRQLLAFARRQAIEPKVLDLNETVEGMLKMLRRLIGEDIDLVWQPGAGLWPVMMDPSQIDQILANLCVNARDAISGVGKVAIETNNARVDNADCANHDGFVPGEFVLLAVSDDGCGMSKEILDNLFEPFFTTKGVGEGTGLGLATVYGIVKQNNGFIYVESEPDKGSNFKIYLPRHAGGTDKIAAQAVAEIARGNGETVLVVEDEASILKLAKKLLTGLGYNVLAAPSPAAAMEMAGENLDACQLLLTDVVMPEMNGRDLADRLRALHPDLKVLFMSGYTADVIAHHGILEEGVHFIQKPFNKRDLARKVREALLE